MYHNIRAALAGNPNVTFARKRIKCGWGEWSLVQATLHAIRAAVDAFPDATHFYLLSSDCMAIKTAESAHRFLDENDVDFIESFDFFTSNWIKTGIKEDRLIYRHVFNERTHKKLFYWSLSLQQWMGLRRRIPEDVEVQIGSQWWCLRRPTIEAILDFIVERPDVTRFFRTTWIPDETYFQTLVRHLVPETEIQTRTLTFLMFTDYGVPVTFYDDHFDLLLAQDFLFARKISPEAKELKSRLGELYSARGVTFQFSNEGRNLHRFLTERGRIGRRFAKRFWEAESTLGRNRELMIVVCKKWHIGKRLAERIQQATSVPALGYLFDEEDPTLPDIGGIQNSLAKRTRHRRALLRMLYDHFDTDRLVICLDPRNLELLQDFFADQSVTRMLDVECLFSDDDMLGHAQRLGLVGTTTSPDTARQLLLTLRNDINYESEMIGDAGFDNHSKISERDDPEKNANILAGFLTVPHHVALLITATDGLFGD